MPELIKAPASAVWPPQDPNKRPRTVGFVWENGNQRTESLWEIAQTENVDWEKFIKLNFDVVPQKPPKDEWARIINWYLKYKLNCKELTKGGNFIFSGGETVYIPIDPPKPPPTPKEQRVGMRYVKYTNGSSAHWTDFLAPGDPVDNKFDKWWNRRTNPDPAPGDPFASTDINDPGSTPIQKEMTETNKSDVLVRIIVETVSDPRSSFGTGAGGYLSLTNYTIYRKRKFIYGAGDRGQKVRVDETRSVRKDDGSVSLVEKRTYLVDQPKDYTR